MCIYRYVHAQEILINKSDNIYKFKYILKYF